GFQKWWSTCACVGETTCPWRPCWGCATSSTTCLGAFARRGASPTRSSSVPRAGTEDAAPIPVSVRATILALVRFSVAAREPARALETAWSAYKKTAGLDPYGHAAASEPSPRSPGLDES